MMKNIIIVGGVISIAIIALYFFGMGPTDLKITGNDSAMNKEINALNISGTTETYATVTINGETVPVDKNGNFYKVVQVPNGKNIYSVDAKAPFKSTKEINVTATRNEDPDGSVSGNWEWNYTFEKLY
jgi:hypothetical protein